MTELKHKELTEKIIKVFYSVYSQLGYGFAEKVYERAMVICLEEAGLKVESQIPIKVHFKGQVIGEYVADVLVENLVILELKAVSNVIDAHVAQLLNYLRGSELEVGLLFNFGPKPEFKRLVFDNRRKLLVLDEGARKRNR